MNTYLYILRIISVLMKKQVLSMKEKTKLYDIGFSYFHIARKNSTYWSAEYYC